MGETKEADLAANRRIRLSKRRILQALLLALILPAMVLFLRAPLREQDSAAKLLQYQTNVKESYRLVQERVAEFASEGLSPETFGSILVDADGVSPITVRQVFDDQHWVDGGETGKADAAYMVDGQGVLVYFTYRSEDKATTWSGASLDEDFLASHGGWNGGKGAGWTGYPV